MDFVEDNDADGLAPKQRFLKLSVHLGRLQMSASYHFTNRAAKVSYRRFAPRSVGPLWADCRHLTFPVGIVAT